MVTQDIYEDIYVFCDGCGKSIDEETYILAENKPHSYKEYDYCFSCFLKKQQLPKGYKYCCGRCGEKSFSTEEDEYSQFFYINGEILCLECAENASEEFSSVYMERTDDFSDKIVYA